VIPLPVAVLAYAGTARVASALRRGIPRAARLVAQRDEQRGDVLAVAVDLGERRTRALRGQPRGGGRIGAEHDGVLGLGPADLRARRDVLNDDVLDGAPPDVVTPSQERARAEHAAERSIVELGKDVRERGRQSRTPNSGKIREL
jgi:hypothetical protein